MVSALLAGALIVAASLACGQAVMALAGRRRFSPVAPAAGFSVLLVVCGVAVKLPGHGTTAALAAGVVVAVSLYVLASRIGSLGPLRTGAVAAALIAAVVVAIPFATSGRVGILGQGLVNDDMASHLLFTDWVDTRDGPTPDLVNDGYPLGPHAIVAATSKASGSGLIEGFAGLTGAIAVLAALTAYGAFGGVRAWLRAPVSVLAALPYLGAAYLAQGAFKEPMLALAVVGFALSLPVLRESWRGYGPTIASTVGTGARQRLKSQVRLAIPGGVIAAGTIYNYSFPGLAWLALTAIAWALFTAWHERERREGMNLRDRLRWASPVIVAGVAIPLVAALPELVRIVSFAGFEAFSPSGAEGNTGFGNLRQPLNPLQALGVWPSSEFRLAASNAGTPAIAFYLGGLLAALALAWGLGRAWSRREAALPAAFVTSAAGYLVALVIGTPYTSAKALAVAAPVVVLIALRGLLSAERLEDESGAEADWWPPRPIRPFAKVAVPALAVAFVAAAAFSTLLPLRQSAVGPTATADRLIRDFRPEVQGEKVLFRGRDNFISWELIGAEDVFSPILNHYDTEETPTLYRATPINAKFDWDNVPVETLAGFDFVITTSSAFNSEAPPEFTAAKTSGDFILWRRTAPTPLPGEPGERRTLREPLFPGTSVDCTDPGKAPLRTVGGEATVLPTAPAVGREWEPGPEVTDARGATQELLLAPGRWEVSLQFATTQELRLAAPSVGLDAELPANLIFRGPSPYYRVSEITVPGLIGGPKVPVRFETTAAEPPLVGRLLGTETRAYLGRIAATPLGDRERVPLAGVCSRYLDWYSTAGAPEAAGVEAPEVQPPQNDGRDQ
ncbi:hypothetical protein BH20ACT15_BH20ACT15_13090 [soil metagenome]